jgi:ribosomal peptide maturation radical SAM protein 1
MRVLLVSMPFATVERPALGLSLLKARLADRDIACDVAYPNLAFAAMLSVEAYQRIATAIPHISLACEWVFSGCLPDAHGGSFVDEILRLKYRVPEADIELLLGARALAADFLASWLDAEDWSRYRVVGFASYCDQNVAALAAARLLKQRHPEILVVFGGPNWQGIMGRALHRCFPFVDVAFLGEADQALPDALARLAKAEDGNGLTGALDAGCLEHVPGIAYRHHGESKVTAAPQPVPDLDALPAPDYTDYFAALNGSRLGEVASTLEIETARGCWWAERRPCLFCGLTGCLRPYRTKTPARILEELRGLAGLWARPLDVADNMVSPEFLSDVLPKLAASPLPVPLFFESRATLTELEVRHIAAAGTTVQVGIESLVDHVLRLMNKGVRALENVRLLRWCRAHGVRVDWNLIFGVPGETDEDYDDLIELLPALHYLQPPATCGPISLDRFSPYHEEPARYGFSNPQPRAAYGYVYPLTEDDLRDVAYGFEYDSHPSLLRSVHMERIRREVRAWQTDDKPGDLRLARDVEGWSLVDTRFGSRLAAVRHLDTLDELLYSACDDICGRVRLHELAEAVCGPRAGLTDEVDRRLETFVSGRQMVTDGDRYLSLALPPVDEAAATS